MKSLEEKLIELDNEVEDRFQFREMLANFATHPWCTSCQQSLKYCKHKEFYMDVLLSKGGVVRRK